jgi:HD superfamily phosphohydrolase
MRRFRDPVHGFVHLTPAELRLVDTRPFRRLRQIKQLGLTYLVYPGAMHTRFEHSLGVMELATRAFDAVDHKSGEVLRPNFARVGLETKEARTLLRATALLHDIGHLPFSHSSEEILPVISGGRRAEHEDVSIAIIRSDEIAGILEQYFYKGIVEHVVLLLDEHREVRPELLILKKIMSSQFDADKMDYLARDSLHCGVGYGNFDNPRLLETLRVKEAETGGLELSLEKSGVHTLEAMMLARYWMFTQVYFHKTRRIYDLYLKGYLRLWYEHQYDDLLDVVKQDDVTMMSQTYSDSSPEHDDSERHRLARRILEREHHRVVYEVGNHADSKDKKTAFRVKEALEKKFPDVNFILDVDASGTVHKFYVKGDEDEGEEFFVYDTVCGRYHPLSEQSRIFEKVPKGFNVVRIYADVERACLPEFRSFASQTAKDLLEGR